MASIRKLFNVKEPVQEEVTKKKIRAFNSIVSILAQIQQEPPFQDNGPLYQTLPDRGEKLQLRLSNAFAHLAVSNTSVVAATLYTPQKFSLMAWIQDLNSGDQDTQKGPESKKPKSISLWDRICWVLAYNTTNDAMRPGSNYQGPCIVKATPPTNYPKRSDPKEALIQYLDDYPKKWNAPEEVSHLWVLAKILTTLKSEPALRFRCMKYVIAASHPKIRRRFETLSSKEYWQCFASVELDSEVIHSLAARAASKRKRHHIELENDFNFLTILQESQIVPDYEKRFPNIAKALKELPNLTCEIPPDVTTHCATTSELFNDTTCKEYHSLFMALMDQYKAFVDKIATAAKDEEPFEDKLDCAVKTGHALLTMVKGRAFYLYLSTIAFKLSDGRIESEERDAEERDAEEHDAEERDAEEGDVKAGTTLWDTVEADTATTVLWKPFKSWIMLMLVQLDAADALCAFVKRVELSNAEIDVKLVYSPLVSDKTISLEDLLTQTYIPEAPMTNLKTNAKLLDFVKTAKTLKSQAKRISSFTEKWDPECASEAELFLQEVLDETKKEHEEDSKQKKDGVDPNKIISELSSEIIGLLSGPAQGADILTKFAALETELKERQRRYTLPFTEKPIFKGALHCEAGLASILDKNTRINIQARIDTMNQAAVRKKDENLYRSLSQLLEDTEGFTRVIGVSKYCCPVCRRFLAFLSLDEDLAATGFVTPGFHNTITSCTLPEWTPELLVDAMNSTFGQLLRNELVKLSEAVRLRSFRDRRQSSGSGVSVGNSDTIVGSLIQSITF